MQKEQLVSPEYLQAILRYVPETGELFWRRRPLEMFNDGLRYSAERNWKIWNTRYADRPALARPNGRGHLHGTLGSLHFTQHRVAWAVHHGSWPAGLIDHINGDGADNRIANLRIATPSENSRNMSRPSHNTSGHIGVSFRKDRRRPWRAHIKVGGRMRDLGQFATIEEAVAARKRAERTLGFHPNHGRAA